MCSYIRFGQSNRYWKNKQIFWSSTSRTWHPLISRNIQIGHGNQSTEIELVRAFMPVLVTSNFDDNSIKNEWASLETPFSHYKYMGNFQTSRTANSLVSGPIWPKFELVWDFMHVLVTCKYKTDQIKKKKMRGGGDIILPIINQLGLSVAQKPKFWSNLPQNLMQLFPHPNDATHKIWSRLANWL